MRPLPLAMLALLSGKINAGLPHPNPGKIEPPADSNEAMLNALAPASAAPPVNMAPIAPKREVGEIEGLVRAHFAKQMFKPPMQDNQPPPMPPMTPPPSGPMSPAPPMEY